MEEILGMGATVCGGVRRVMLLVRLRREGSGGGDGW